MLDNIAIGTILENSIRQFTKIISVKNSLYGISGWSTLESAKKSTVAMKFINSFGLKYGNVRIVESADGNSLPKAKKVAKKVAKKTRKPRA